MSLYLETSRAAISFAREATASRYEAAPAGTGRTGEGFAAGRAGNALEASRSSFLRLALLRRERPVATGVVLGAKWGPLGEVIARGAVACDADALSNKDL